MSSQSERDEARRNAIRKDRAAKDARKTFYDKSAARAEAIVAAIDLGVRPTRLAKDLGVSTAVISRLVGKTPRPQPMSCPECERPCRGFSGLGVHRRAAHGVISNRSTR